MVYSSPGFPWVLKTHEISHKCGKVWRKILHFVYCGRQVTRSLIKQFLQCNQPKVKHMHICHLASELVQNHFRYNYLLCYLLLSSKKVNGIQRTVTCHFECREVLKYGCYLSGNPDRISLSIKLGILFYCIAFIPSKITL